MGVLFKMIMVLNVNDILCDGGNIHLTGHIKCTFDTLKFIKEYIFPF